MYCKALELSLRGFNSTYIDDLIMFSITFVAGKYGIGDYKKRRN